MMWKTWIGRSAALFCLCAVTVFATGCDMFGADSGAAQMTVKFGAASSASKAQAASKSGAAEELALTGTNGDQLTITDVRLLVEKLKFERDDDACEEELDGAEVEDDDSCEEEFESDPFMIDVPLSGDGTVAVATGEVPPGVYTKFEFEVDDLDLFEEDDEEEKAAVEALAEAVRAEFPEWPEDASMVVVGTFTPAGGEPQSFTTYVEAEIEVEMAFEPALDLAEGSSEALRVEVLPEAWFVEDGSVIDLAAYRYVEGQESELLELTLKLKDGFRELRVEHDD